MKPYFLTTLDVELVAEGEDAWILRNPFAYHSEVLGMIVTVPPGFVTDFASVPRLPVIYMLTGNTAHRPAVIHDFLYTTSACERKQADEVFLEAMEVVGIPAWKRYPMYWGVRAFGGSHFKKKEKGNANGN